jgi:hypothetical protein
VKRFLLGSAGAEASVRPRRLAGVVTRPSTSPLEAMGGFVARLSASSIAKIARIGATLILGAVGQLLGPLSAVADTGAGAHCLFRQSGERFSGTCGKAFDENPTFTVSTGPKVRSGMWREDLQPKAVWAGTMTEGSSDFPVELEIYEGQHGILRTEHGWFAVSHFTAAQDLNFDLDASREIKPGPT